MATAAGSEFGSPYSGAGARVDTLFGAVSQANHRELLDHARDLVQGRIATMLTATMAEVERDLFATADASRISTEQTVLLDAMLRLREFRTQLAGEFQTEFAGYFDRALQGTLDEEEIETDSGVPWSLVGEDEVSEATVIADLARRAKNNLDHMQLFEVRMRMAELLAIDPDDDAANPLAPEAIFSALLRACERMPAAPHARRATLAAFHPYVTREIAATYAELNEFLLNNNVAAPIRPLVQPSRSTKNVDGEFNWAGRAGGGSANSANSTGFSGASSSLPSSTADTGASETRGPVADGSSAPTLQSAIGTLLGAGNAHSTLVDALTQVLAQPPEARRMVVRMLADPVRHGFEAALGVPPSPELLSTLSARQASGDARTELPVELRADSHPLDLLTIEFVTLIFGALLSDDTIDAALRAEVGRLQVVAIKAALLDRTFFANRRHPMRRLLDQVSMLAIDVEIDVRTGSTYQLGLRAIIDELMRDFDTDLSVFPVAMQALDALHQRCRAPAIQAISSATTEIESAEHRERIQTTCLAEVRRRAGPRAPLEIRTFLETWWVQVLAECYGNTAPDTLCWQHRLAVADQLVWSVSSLGSAEVTRLALTLPTIMRDLRQGMDAVAMPLPEREDFFVKLMALHTHTIQRAKARAVTASEISLIPAEFTPAPPPVTQPRVAPLPANLRVGVVVELMMKGRATPMKLVWISSSRKTYVFSSQSQHAHAVPALALGDALAAGRARIVSKNEPLIDRLIQKLTHA